MPVGPEDSPGFDVHVHGVDAHGGVSLEGLGPGPALGVEGSNLVIIRHVQDLTLTV